MEELNRESEPVSRSVSRRAGTRPHRDDRLRLDRAESTVRVMPMELVRAERVAHVTSRRRSGRYRWRRRGRGWQRRGGDGEGGWPGCDDRPRLFYHILDHCLAANPFT